MVFSLIWVVEDGINFWIVRLSSSNPMKSFSVDIIDAAVVAVVAAVGLFVLPDSHSFAIDVSGRRSMSPLNLFQSGGAAIALRLPSCRPRFES